ncbi:hypothetical protein [Amycolatopsis echigonensis]|uniref:hypothetical protein n=1 Tax=Amycolatopsis echigonensis TaxID=2576905 RepID=UPI000C712EAE|nr:hypothetical protein [Amycolatopsis niigatensis]
MTFLSQNEVCPFSIRHSGARDNGFSDIRHPDRAAGSRSGDRSRRTSGLLAAMLLLEAILTFATNSQAAGTPVGLLLWVS